MNGSHTPQVTWSGGGGRGSRSEQSSPPPGGPRLGHHPRACTAWEMQSREGVSIHGCPPGIRPFLPSHAELCFCPAGPDLPRGEANLHSSSFSRDYVRSGHVTRIWSLTCEGHSAPRRGLRPRGILSASAVPLLPDPSAVSGASDVWSCGPHLVTMKQKAADKKPAQPRTTKRKKLFADLPEHLTT